MDISLRDLVEIGVIAVTFIGFFYKVKYTMEQNTNRLTRLEKEVASLKKK